MSELKKRITNTAKTGVRHDWVLGQDPKAIEAQEARGQDQLVNSSQLPVNIRGDKASLEAAGVQFGEPLKGDPLFCNATLPAGWEKRPTDHSMWSELLDEQGNRRALIFYKAAFYDRDAFMNVEASPTLKG